MAIEDLVTLDTAAKALTGKSGELPCKHYVAGDYSSHTPANEVVQELAIPARYCGAFDGAAARTIATLSSGSVSLPFTVSAWVKQGTSPAATGRIWSVLPAAATTTYFTLWQHSNTALNIERRNGANVGTEILAFDNGPTNNTWYHVTVSYVSTTSVIAWLNGERIYANSGLAAVDIAASSNSLVLGALRNASPTGYFKGNIADVRLYESAFTDDDARLLYRGYDFQVPAPLIDIPFDDRAGSPARERTGNTNGATINGVTAATFWAAAAASGTGRWRLTQRGAKAVHLHTT